MGAQGAGAPCSNSSPQRPSSGGPMNPRAHSFAVTDGEDGPLL